MANPILDDWELMAGSGVAEPSGTACDHVNRYPQDIALLAQGGLGCYRFSVEWSRIEPAEGQFSERWLDHYRGMAACCVQHGMLAVPTLHHFTNPRWIAQAGGWEAPSTAVGFARFCAMVADALWLRGELTTYQPAVSLIAALLPLDLGFAIGSGYLFETTFQKEVYADLTGERGVLMGAIYGLWLAQYEVLREHGHSPSEAFNETV